MFDDSEPTPIYLNRAVQPGDRKVIDQLTASRHWDYPKFQEVIVALASVGEYLPASNRPDSIHIQGFRPKLERLSELAKEHGRETVQPIFADIESGKFVFGRITKGTLVGNQHTVRTDTMRQKGREHLQKLALSAHIHPGGEGALAGGMGFSDTDYIGFLSDPEEIGQIIKVGETVFMCLKTSVTPNNMKPEDVTRRVKQIVTETVDDKSKTTLERLVNLNRSVCTEFGMVLYMATGKTRDLMERVPVAV